MAADQFCLRWNNYQVNITSALESLKNDEDLVDVTLTCEGQNVKAHKVILSACSPYFRKVFKENPCQHPVVILKDVKYEDVTALLDFMYNGEVYITQDRLASFLHTAELLQVRGLTGAASPFKELQSSTPPPLPKTLLSQQQQQQPLKVKKNFMQSQCGQLRRATPPLAVSPSSVPLSTPLKMHRVQRSPVVSPSPKDPGTSTLSCFVKEKSRESSQAIPNRESEIESSAKPTSPVGISLQDHQSGACYSASGVRPCTSYSPLYSDQSTFSTTSNSAASQPVSNEPNCQLLPIANVSRVQILGQSSSPPLPAAKRRKAFPRRVSNSQLPLDQPSSPLNVSDSVKEPPHETADTAESDTVFKETSVKVEQCDVELDNEQTEGEDSSSYTQGHPEDVDMESGEYSKQKMESFDDQILEEQDMAGEETDESGMMPSSQNMLLRSLSGQPVGNSQSDDNGLVQKQLDEESVLRRWTDHRDTNVHYINTSWEVDGRNPDNLRMIEIENFDIAHANSVNILTTPVEQQVESLHQTLITENNINHEASRNLPQRERNRNLYQKRKHSWQSRRPVQCPNCSKTISMAYNLKSHLSSCLKRLGVVGNNIST